MKKDICRGLYLGCAKRIGWPCVNEACPLLAPLPIHEMHDGFYDDVVTETGRNDPNEDADYAIPRGMACGIVPAGTRRSEIGLRAPNEAPARPGFLRVKEVAE